MRLAFVSTLYSMRSELVFGAEDCGMFTDNSDNRTVLSTKNIHHKHKHCIAISIVLKYSA